eukprot:gene17030-19411_t
MDAAKRAVRAVRHGVKVLGLQSSVGRPIEDMPVDFREWIIDFGDSGYVARYRINSDVVIILARSANYRDRGGQLRPLSSGAHFSATSQSLGNECQHQRIECSLRPYDLQKGLEKMIRSKGFSSEMALLFLFTQVQQLKVHPAYKLAKAGDQDAALELVIDVAVPWLYEQRYRFGSGLLFVAPHAQEATGDNAIPQTLSSVCAEIFDGTSDTEIVQSDRVYHTGADPMERMAARAQFVGRVLPGAEYVLVDDVTSLRLNTEILTQVAAPTNRASY